MSARSARPDAAGARPARRAAFGLDKGEIRERNDDGRPDS